MKKKTTTKIMSYLLTTAMIVGGLSLSPLATVEVQAANKRNINLNVNNNIEGIDSPTSGTTSANPLDSWAGTTVYYGDKEYYVLDKNGQSKDKDNSGSGHSSLPGNMLLLSKGVMPEDISFDTTLSNWTGSGIETYLNGDGFYNTSFTVNEQGAISNTPISNENTEHYVYSSLVNSNNYIFLLDLNDVRNTNYGFCSLDAASGTRVANPNCGFTSWWWLRSSGGLFNNAAFVKDTGTIDSNGNDVATGVASARPAFNLKLSSVLFSSESGEGKSPSFAATTDGSGISSWKLTLKDESGTFLYERVDNNAPAAKQEIKIDVKEISGLYDNITAMILDDDNIVLGYGKISDASTGIKTFTIPDNVTGGTKIKFFAEKWNEGNKTDYAREGGVLSTNSDDRNNDSSLTTTEEAYVNPLVWNYEGNQSGSQCQIEHQGELCVAAFNAATPKGYKEAFSFNLLLKENSLFKLSYVMKTGKFVLNVPKEWRKAGRKFLLIGIDKYGNTKTFSDTDLSDETFITMLDVEGYAFSLIYIDEPVTKK